MRVNIIFGLFIALVLVFSSANAQDFTVTTPKDTMASPQTPCTKEMAYQTVGKWGKQRVDDLAMADDSFPKTEHKTVLLKAQKVVELLKSANPELIGVDASAKRMIRGDSYFPNGALKFGITSGYAAYFCVPNNNGYAAERRGTIVLGGGGGSSINVYFNDFGMALEEIKGDGKFVTADSETLFYLPKQLDDFKGMNVLQPTLNEGIKEAIIITPNHRLPYKPVSREQFIQSRIKYYREFYRSLERSSFEPVIAELNLMLANMSSAERQTQAIVRDPFAGKDRLFMSEAKGGKPVVSVDRDFFNAKLPRSTIQLIIVYLDWNKNDIAVAEAMRKFKQNFDFELLKQMLGK